MAEANSNTEPRWELADRLSSLAKNLTGRRKIHFVDDKTLCAGCKYATIVRLRSDNSRTIICGVLGRAMPHNVDECSAYGGINELSIGQMTDMATLIDPRDLTKGYL